MLELFSLTGKVALVTGASRGLGRAMAGALAAAGAHVTLLARDRVVLDEAVAEIVAKGGRADAFSVDLCDQVATRAAVAEVVERHGRFDILVNNAGTIRWSRLGDSGLDDWDEILGTNLDAAFVLAQESARVMRAAGNGGRIINIGSVLSILGRGKLAAYCTSKAALVGLTRSLAAELGRDAITVNCIAPGYFETDINTGLLARPGFPETVAGATPMARWGRPEELAGTVVYLASAASAYVTGQLLMVDGGMSSTFTFQLPA